MISRRIVLGLLACALVSPVLLGGPSSARAGAPAAVVFASDRDDGFYEIYSMAADGSSVTRLTNDPGFDEHPAWSPDGTQIAWDSSRGGQRQIWVMDADGGNVRRVSAEDAFGSYPAWSPDGRRIAYLGGTDEDENIDVYLMDLEGLNVQRLTDDPAWDASPSWSRDGSQIAFVSERDGNREIYVMNAVGSDQTNVINYPTIDDQPDWSPSDGTILFVREGELFTTAPDGSSKFNLTGTEDESESEPSWASDGYHIVYVTTLDGNPEIYVSYYSPAPVQRLTDNPANDLSPDWRRGAYAGLGDVSCGGVINAVDSALILQLSAGLIEALTCPQNADVNVDGLVNSVDSLLILQYTAGLIDSLPP